MHGVSADGTLWPYAVGKPAVVPFGGAVELWFCITPPLRPRRNSARQSVRRNRERPECSADRRIANRYGELHLAPGFPTPARRMARRRPTSGSRGRFGYSPRPQAWVQASKSQPNPSAMWRNRSALQILHAARAQRTHCTDCAVLSAADSRCAPAPDSTAPTAGSILAARTSSAYLARRCLDPPPSRDRMQLEKWKSCWSRLPSRPYGHEACDLLTRVAGLRCPTLEVNFGSWWSGKAVNRFSRSLWRMPGT